MCRLTLSFTQLLSHDWAAWSLKLVVAACSRMELTAVLRRSAEEGRNHIILELVVYETECRHVAVHRGKQDQNHL